MNPKPKSGTNVLLGGSAVVNSEAVGRKPMISLRRRADRVWVRIVVRER